MTTLYIRVNPIGSIFAKTLKDGLETLTTCKVLRVDHNKPLKPNANTFTIPLHGLNKLEQLNAFTNNNIACPEYRTDARQVQELGRTVFARTLLNSTNGRGIVEFEPGVGETPQAPLYVAYIPKKAEYRVHVFDGQVIDVQQKKKRTDVPETNGRIRNLANGYVFCRENIVVPTGLLPLAVSAVNALDYSYGAVDIIYNEKQGKCYVLEVNSRPGVEGSTVDKYVQALINKFNLERK